LKDILAGEVKAERAIRGESTEIEFCTLVAIPSRTVTFADSPKLDCSKCSYVMTSETGDLSFQGTKL
jgi:hypothetical protein